MAVIPGASGVASGSAGVVPQGGRQLSEDERLRVDLQERAEGAGEALKHHEAHAVTARRVLRACRAALEQLEEEGSEEPVGREVTGF